MIDYSSIRPALLSLIKQLSGVSDVSWRDQPQGYQGKPVASYGSTVGTSIKLSIGPSSTKGRDEIRTSFDGSRPAGQELKDTASGVRLFTLKILIDTLEQKDGKTADYLCEQIGGRFRWSLARNALRAVNVGYVDTGVVQDLSSVRDTRAVSVAAIDIRLSTTSVDEEPEGYTYIETASATGSFDD